MVVGSWKKAAKVQETILLVLGASKHAQGNHPHSSISRFENV